MGALKAMGELKMGLSKDELQPIVDAWRAANPNIVQFWHEVNNASTRAISTSRPLTLRNLGFEKKSRMLFIILPSGRRLAYVKQVVA